MNTTSYKALIIPAAPTHPIRLQNLETAPGTLESMVNGEVEAVIRGDWYVYLNAEGRAADLPVNLRAAQLMHDCGVDVEVVPHGTAVFIGRGKNWCAADVPEHLVRRAEHLFGYAQAA